MSRFNASNETGPQSRDVGLCVAFTGSSFRTRRQTVFGRTMQGFPFSLKTSHALKIREQHVITVTGKGFFDVAHAPGNHSNRRTTPKEYAVWEIHPVMALHVDQ
jgi:hypothetical protein